jgi:allophanate hydrolase subunit 2
MDSLAHRTANALVGNPEDAAGVKTHRLLKNNYAER